MYSELIIREVLAVGRQAKYGGVDLGIKENVSRGVALSGLSKPLNNGFVLWVTFVADTMHNRCLLLQKKDIEVFFMNELDELVQILPSWISNLFGSLESVSRMKVDPPGVATDSSTPQNGLDAEDSVRLAQGGAVSSGLPTNIKPPAPPPQAPAAKGRKPGKAAEATTPPPPQASAMPSDEEVSIASLADFIALSEKDQFAAIAAGMPDELMQEIITYDGKSIKGEVIEAAFTKVNH